MFTSLYGASSKDFKFGGADSSAGGESILQKLERKYDEIDVIASIPIEKIEKNINKGYDTWHMVLDLWHTFVIADMLVNTFAILLVLLFAILGFIFRKKTFLSNTLIMLALISYPLVKSIASKKINNFARKSKIENLQVKTFKYSTNIFISGDLVNYGKYTFKNCTIDIVIYKKTDRLPINLVNKIRPLAQEKIEMKDLKVNEFRGFSLTIFSIPKNTDFETQIKTKCK